MTSLGARNHYFRVGVAITVLAGIVWFLYRGLLIAAFCAKALGYPAILDTLKPTPAKHTFRLAGTIADEFYMQSGATPLLIVHGVNATGKDSPQLQVMGAALAQVGFRAIIPDLAELKRQHVSPADAQVIQELLVSTNAEGVVCVSYGCGPALLAAASLGEAGSLRFVMTYGGYFDMRETLRHIVTGPPTPLSYGKWLYLAANADFVEDAQDQEHVRRISLSRDRGETEDGSLLDSLTPAARSTLRLFESRAPEDFDERYLQVPEYFRNRVNQISPSTIAARIRARLIILHGAQDPCIPSSESARLAEVAGAAGRDYTLTLIGVPGHTAPSWPPLGVGSVFHTYLPEGWKLWRVARELLSFA